VKYYTFDDTNQHKEQGRGVEDWNISYNEK